MFALNARDSECAMLGLCFRETIGVSAFDMPVLKFEEIGEDPPLPSIPPDENERVPLIVAGPPPPIRAPPPPPVDAPLPLFICVYFSKRA